MRRARFPEVPSYQVFLPESDQYQKIFAYLSNETKGIFSTERNNPRVLVTIHTVFGVFIGPAGSRVMG